jgi:mycobactin lysine-N-oxygenase
MTAKRERIAYDLVVVAVGFDARWFYRLLGPRAQRRLDGIDAEHRIDVDLSIAGFSPAIHLPLLAGLAQGPGFPNLSCLGLLSDRVLRHYLGQSGRAGSTTRRSEHA